jgi:calcineurin-like phosphoesterase family protein
MDYALIDAINRVVGVADILWVLGDFVWKPRLYGHYRQQIRARQVHIVAGNHDTPALARYVSSYSDMVFRKFGEHKFHLSHYPHASWRCRTHGSIHLYGHTHGTLEDTLNEMWPGRRAMDVGVDHVHRLTGNWCPLSLDEILSLLGVVTIP